MKKLIVLLVTVCATALSSYAIAAENCTNSTEPTYSEASNIYYSGPAYSMADNELVPHAGPSVSVNWTSDGCSINGKPGSQPQHIQGGYPMHVNGKVKYMNYRVNYGGEFYYFQA
ncbi:MAG: hypothetical protein K2M40_08260 [Muribaculaceae bacterium]|nr:hypothetical protein [Muribaculaceae bacterium]